MSGFTRKILFTGGAVLFALVMVLAFTTCDIGLGEMVNTEKPAISIPEDGSIRPGGFLNGTTNLIKLEVEQPFGLTEVFVTIWYICDDPNHADDGCIGLEHTRIIPAEQDPETGLWFYNLDTTGMRDGTIRSQVTAIDISGNVSVTTDILFNVKNTPPEIELTIPTSVRGRQFDWIDNDLNQNLTQNEPLMVGFDLMGLATDDRGIKLGYPKIMIWPVLDEHGQPTQLNANGEPIDPKWGTWRSTVTQGARHGVTATRFSYPMRELIQDASAPGGWRLPVLSDGHLFSLFLPAGNYRFKLWIKDTNGCTEDCFLTGCTNDSHGVSNFYPHRTNNERVGHDGSIPANPNEHPTKFIEIRHVNAEIPIPTFLTVPTFYNIAGYMDNSSPPAVFVPGNFVSTLLITSSNPIQTATAWVQNSANYTTATFRSPIYNLTPPDPNHVNENWRTNWRFEITEDMARAWFTQHDRPLRDSDGNPILEANLFLFVAATDANNNTSPPGTFRNFNFDIRPPEVRVDRPVAVPQPFAAGEFPGGSFEILHPLYDALNPMPRWVTGRITIGGINMDTHGISRIYYHIGKLGDDSSTLTIPDRASIYESVQWQDTMLHERSSHTNADGGIWSGSLYAWNYQFDFNDWGRHKNCGSSCSDPVLHDKVKDLIQESSELYTAGGGSHFNGTNYITENRARFYLPFYVKVVDTANNFHIVHYKLCIDPDLDIPFVSISTPSPDNDGKIIIGGEVNLSGLASDNDWIHSVQIRIKKYGSNGNHPNLYPGGVDDKGAFWYYRPYRHNTTQHPDNLIPFIYDIDPNFPVPEGDPNTADSKAGWFEAVRRNNDMVVGWFFNINSYGGLDPEGSAQSVDVRIEVRAVDSKNRGLTPHLVGAPVIMDVEFSSGVPRIEDVQITKAGVNPRDYFEGITASGNFNVVMNLSDDGRLRNIRTLINGQRYDLLTNFANSSTLATISAGLSITPPANIGGRDVSTLTINIDTVSNALYSEFGFGRTGAFTIEVEVHDDSEPTFITRSRFTIGIDNFYPTTTIETARNASSNESASPPRRFDLGGIATDTGAGSGPIQDLARVLVWFEDVTMAPDGTLTGTGIFRNPRGRINNSSGQAGEDDNWYFDRSIYRNTDNNSVSGNWHQRPQMVSYPNVRRENQISSGPSAWGTTFNNFPILEQIFKGAQIGYVWESPHAMVIDNHELEDDLDEDGTIGEVWSGLVEKTWRAWMDTQAFRDGPLMVHYVVMDSAGNATHYEKPIFIENNKPEVVNINLGTSIRGNNNIAGWTSSTDPGEFMGRHFPIEDTAAGNRIVTFTDVLDNPFRVRGNRLALRMETRRGNGDKWVRVSYVTPLPTIAATAMVRGQVYTIETSGTTDWQRYGAPNNAVQTTFVASGPGEGNGRVVPYHVVTSTAPKLLQDTGGGTTHNIGNETLIFEHGFGSGTNQIPDSTKTSEGDIQRPLLSRPANWPSGWSLNQPERLFIVKVYDSTVTLTGSPTDEQIEANQLAHAVLVALDIDNTDSKPPTISVAPFGQRYALRLGGNIGNDADRVIGDVLTYNENIVMNGTSRQGYVQYAVHSSGSNADISGQVIFTGKAADNQRIQNIYVQIPGYDGGGTGGAGNPFRVAEYHAASGTLVPTRTEMGSAVNQRWFFRVFNDSLTLDYGHTVNWEFAWDSSYVTNQVGTPQVQFRVNDFRPGTPTPGQSNLGVNIIPYISEVETRLSGVNRAQPSAFARSSTGWYPVRENEVVTVRGFNLGVGASTGVTVNNPATIVVIGGTVANNGTITDGTVINPTIVAANRNQLTFDVGTTANSGDLTVRVNGAVGAVAGVNSINNRTKLLNDGVIDTIENRLEETNRVTYNWEPNRVNNNILTNERKLYIWTVGSLLNITAEAQDPVMAVSPTGHRSLVMTNGTNGNAFRHFNNHTSITAAGTVMGDSVNRFINFGLTVDATTNWYIISSNMTGNQTNHAWLHARGAPSALNSTAGASTNKSRIVPLGTTNASPNRVRIPKIHASGDRVVISYGDGTQNNRIHLHYGTVTGAATATFGGGYTGAGSDAVVQVITDATSTYRGSIYTAVATLPNGQPVIAWFDERAGQERLLFSYGNADNTYATANAHGGAATWNSRAAIVHGTGATGGRPTGAAGAYVDMAVDPAGNVHLAYYDVNNGGLYYAFIPRSGIPITTGNAVTTAAVTGIEVVRVDTYLAAGTDIKISVRDESRGASLAYRPYISYFHASFAQTRNSIRVAWPVTTVNSTTGKFSVEHGTDDFDSFRGTWEVMTVPSVNVPLVGNFVCNGVPRTTGNWQNITAAAGSIGSYANINRTILVGYMTRGTYEGAILKRDIWLGP